MYTDFYKAWWYLYGQKAFRDEYEEEIINIANEFKIKEYNKFKSEKKKLFNETLQLKRQIYNKYPSGGVLHIVLDDGNLKLYHIKYCLNEAKQLTKDRDLFVVCCNNLLRMTPTQRLKLYKTV